MPCRPSFLQPDRAIAQRDRERLERLGARRLLDDARQWFERALRAAGHLTGSYVVAGRVPWTLKASFASDLTLPQRGEEMATAVRNCERLAVTHADGERAVRRLDDGYLPLVEIVDGDKAGSAGCCVGHAGLLAMGCRKQYATR